MLDVCKLTKPYEFVETGVGCKAHNDPHCLCDVVIETPVAINHALGGHSTAVMFSQTVNRQINVKEDWISHVQTLLGLCDEAHAKQRYAHWNNLQRAEAEIHAEDVREFSDDSNPRFDPTPEQEYWLRRDMPHSWAAWNCGVNLETVRQWRKRNGVKITDRGPNEWQQANSRRMNRLKDQKPVKHRIDFTTPEAERILSDRSISAIDAAGMLHSTKGTIIRQRAMRGIRGEATGGRKTGVDWSSPDVIAVLDGNLSEREAARALGVAQTTVHRYRKERDTLSQ